jgi:DNA-binding CsgD family transcriptional regulator
MVLASYISIVSSAFWVAIISYVLFYRPRSVQLRIFILLTLTSLVLSIASIFLYSAPDAGSAWFRHHFTSAAWVIIICLGMLLILYFYYDNNNPGIFRIVLVIVPSIVFLYRAVFYSTMAKEYISGPYGYYPVNAIDSVWFYLYGLYCLEFIILNYYYLVKKYRSSERNRVRAQAVVYITAVTVPVIFASFYEILSPLLQITKVPAIGHFAMLPYLLIVLFAMTRYRMMMIDVPFTADMIIDRTSSLVVLFNEQGLFVSMNKSGLDILGYDDTCKEQCGFRGLFIEQNKVNDMVSKAMQNGNHIMSEDLSLRGFDGAAVPMHVSIGIVFDDFRDHIGYVVMGNRIDVLDTAQKQFGITEREKTILVHLLQGLGYEDIADELDISLFTVKNHVHNIYQKTGAKNRSELMKVAFVRESG